MTITQQLIVWAIGIVVVYVLEVIFISTYYKYNKHKRNEHLYYAIGISTFWPIPIAVILFIAAFMILCSPIFIIQKFTVFVIDKYFSKQLL